MPLVVGTPTLSRRSRRGHVLTDRRTHRLTNHSSKHRKLRHTTNAQSRTTPPESSTRSVALKARLCISRGASLYPGPHPPAGIATTLPHMPQAVHAERELLVTNNCQSKAAPRDPRAMERASAHKLSSRIDTDTHLSITIAAFHHANHPKQTQVVGSAVAGSLLVAGASIGSAMPATGHNAIARAQLQSQTSNILLPVLFLK